MLLDQSSCPGWWHQGEKDRRLKIAPSRKHDVRQHGAPETRRREVLRCPSIFHQGGSCYGFDSVMPLTTLRPSLPRRLHLQLACLVSRRAQAACCRDVVPAAVCPPPCSNAMEASWTKRGYGSALARAAEVWVFGIKILLKEVKLRKVRGCDPIRVMELVCTSPHHSCFFPFSKYAKRE